MLLINLHPAEPERRRVRTRRARMTDAQKATTREAEAARQRARRVADPVGVRAYEAAQYREGTRRANNLKAGRKHKLSSYGLTESDYQALVLAQGDRCACCGGVDKGERRERWCVDHDHLTGKVRGLVCHSCNAGIGMLGDSVEGVRKALAYLTRSEAKPW